MRTFLLVIALAAATPAAATAQKDNARPRYYGRVRVLCIGVENYKKNGIGPAKYSINDAKELGELFAKTYGFEVEYVTGENAKREAIKGKVDDLCKVATDRDALIIFFAGHGIVFDSSPEDRHGFFVPWDADVNLDNPKDTKLARWKADCLDMQELVKQVEGCKAHHAVIIADTCCSGYMTGRGSLEQSIELRLLLKGKGRTALAATTEKQGARWNEKVRHGVFTHALIEALKHFDQEAASITDIFVELRKVIPAKTEGGMLPMMQPLGKGHGEFVFLPLFLTEGEVKIVEEELAGERARSRYTRGLADRLFDRAKWRATVQDVLEASRTYVCHYDFSDTPNTTEAAWMKRVERLKENVVFGDPLAMAALHYCYAHKIGVEKKDEKIALHYAQLAYSTGHPAGLHVMARCYQLGIGGLSANRIAYDRLIYDAAKAGFPISQYSLGLDYEVAGKDNAANAEFEKAVKGGYDVARPKAVWGRLYAAAQKADKEADEAKGYAIMKKAYQEATDFLADGAKAGCHICSYELASRYAKDSEVLDNKKAIAYLERAAKAGYGIAQATLARELAREWWMIEKDQPFDMGLVQEHPKALKWALQAAEQNNGEAHLVLANMYRFGSKAARIKADWGEAKKHCEKAAELKHPCANVLLSDWHLKGIVVTRKPDQNAAFALAAEAAATQDNRACLWMGDLYWNHWVPDERLPKEDKLADGKRVMKHHALHYYILAATSSQGSVSAYSGLQTAKDRLREKSKELRPGELKRFYDVYPKETELFEKLTAQWVGSETLPGFGKLTFTMFSGSKAVMVDAASRVEGTWKQNGNQFTLSFGDGGVVYSGTLSGGTLSGTATSGKSNWKWTVHARWEGSETLSGFGKLSFTMLPNGKAIMVDAKSRVEGTWKQNGNRFALSFGDGGVLYSGTLDGGTLSGIASSGNEKWQWTVHARPAN